MKFDSLMNFLYRVLCVAVSAIVVIGCIVSCSSINARAWEPGGDPVYYAQQADSYREQLEHGLVQAEQAMMEDIQNGNLDSSSALAKQYLYAMAIQAMCLQSQEFSIIYHSADLALQGLPSDFFDNPSEITISGSCTAGYYSYNDEIKTGYLYEPTNPGSFTLFSSPDMVITLVPSDLTVNWGNYSHSQTSAFWDFGFGVTAPSLSIDVHSSSNLQSDFIIPSRVAVRSRVRNPYTQTTIPVWSSGNFITDGNSSNPDRVLIGIAIDADLPNGEISSNSPQDYYNDVVLPYIRENIPTIPDSYIVFPYGYQYQDPTEPLTVPNGGIYIDKQVNIGINIFTPTDASGQPITDASGETVTETQYITATYPPDGEYRFQIPTIEPLNLYEATVPNPDLSPFTDGFSFIWNATYHFFNDTGFMPVVMACLSLSVIGYIIWKVGG